MSVATAPLGPRAMVQNRTADSSVSTWERVFHSVATRLYPRLALFEALTGFKDAHRQRKPSGDDICEARRNFMDSFAYICDTEKGGATVTATGLQKLLHSNILWLGANEGIGTDIQVYAENILHKLKELEFRPQKAVQEEIFRLVVEKCTPRIMFYDMELRKYARNCRMQLRQEMPNERVGSLRSKLKKLSEPPSNMTLADLIDRCYAMRGADVDEIRERSKVPEDDFSRLAHYIGRVGATRSSVDAVVEAMIKVPSLQKISNIRKVSTPEPRALTIGQGSTSPYEIVWAICKETASPNPVQIQSALHAIVDLDYPFNGGIRTSLASRKSIMTRVHAELQIADRFSRDQYVFVDDDKYIGCSKPACYFCYGWLANHKHKYVLPATHNKIITGCRGPDGDVNEAGATILTEMYTKIWRGTSQMPLYVNGRLKPCAKSNLNEADGEPAFHASTINIAKLRTLIPIVRRNYSVIELGTALLVDIAGVDPEVFQPVFPGLIGTELQFCIPDLARACLFPEVIEADLFIVSTPGMGVWNVQTGECQHTLEGHSSRSTSVLFSPDGTRMASGSDDNTVRIWDVQTGKCQYKFEGHAGKITSVVFSPDGTRLASGSRDMTVHVWNVQTRECQYTLECHSSRVTSVVFSPDGTRPASGSWDQTVRLWDVACATELLCHNTQVSDRKIEFNDDSTEISVNGEAIPISIQTPLCCAMTGSPGRNTKSPSNRLGIDGDWATWSSERLLWLPFEYRPGLCASHSGTLIIGSDGGRLTFLSHVSSSSPV